MHAVTRIRWLIVAIIAAAVLVLVLGYQNRELRRQNLALIEQLIYPYEGMWVPATPARDTAGAPVALGNPASGAQLLYFFNPDCRFCMASNPAVRDIAHALSRSGKQVTLIAVSEAATAASLAYARQQQFAFPVVADMPRRVTRLFHASEVPVLMVIGTDGKVSKFHVGTLKEKEDRDALLHAALAAADAPPTPSTPAAVAAMVHSRGLQ